MPIFGSKKPAQPTDEERRAVEVDLERIRQGGIPLGAEERLKRVAAASTPFFTSDLTAKEYALAQASGLQPVAQVMGSSVVKHGWRTAQGGYYSTTGEMRALAEPWNLARSRAFDRMRQEAQLADADGIIGIEMSVNGALGDVDNVEFVVFGTAVRDSVLSRRRDGAIRTCALSGQDVDKLRRIGAEVCGVVGYTTVISVRLAPNSNYVMNSGGWLGGSVNTEVLEITNGVYEARHRAMSEVRRQAEAVGANDLVISTLSHSIDHTEYDQGGYRVHFFYVTMHVLGTAIQLGAHPPHPTPMPTPTITMNVTA